MKYVIIKEQKMEEMGKVMEQTVFSVSEINREVKMFLEGTRTFKNIFIEGELSNITYYRSGHLYFTLKDSSASVKCAIFRYKYRNVPEDLKEGDSVKIRGNVTLYEANGSYQIVADFLEKSNSLGLLYEKMEMLKKLYFEKGYFSDEIKKKLPQLPINVGVVTADTGAAIIENATRYNQRVFRGELGNMEEIAKKENIVSPALIVVGNVCKKNLSFFNKYRLPLSGKNILLTATRLLAEKMTPRFKEVGANICEMSLIATKEIEIGKDRLECELNNSTHILFTSSNGVNIFFEQIKKYGIDIRSLYNKKICVIGSGSGEALNKYGVNPDFIPSRFDSKSFLDEILPQLDKSSKVLMLRAKLGSDVLPNGLKSAGIGFSDIPIYDTVIDYRKKFELNRNIESFDYVVVASVSAAKALIEMIEDDSVLNGRVVSIGPVTTKALLKLNIEKIITAKQYDVKGIVDAIKGL